MPIFQSWLELLAFLSISLPVAWLALTRRLDSLVCIAAAKIADFGYILWNVSELARLLKKSKIRRLETA